MVATSVAKMDALLVALVARTLRKNAGEGESMSRVELLFFFAGAAAIVSAVVSVLVLVAVALWPRLPHDSWYRVCVGGCA